VPKLRHRKWFRRWCASLGLVAFLYAIALPPTLTLALNTPLPPLRVGIIDLLWGAPETAIGSSSQYLTGSVLRQKGKDVNVAVAPATGKPAPHIEYSDPSPVRIPELSILGKRWVIGKVQLVKGGFGPLAVMFGGLEPTGRKVVELGVDNEAEFKLVLHSINESKGTVTFQAYVRACIRKPGSKKWLTCTPYAIPTGFFIPFRETDMMPIDINKPAFGFSLTPNVKAQIKQALSPQNLRQIGIQAAGSVASSIGSGGVGGGSSPRSQGSIASPGAYGGTFTGQTMNPVNAPQTSSYGPRRSPCSGCSSNHRGIDYGVPSGTTVLAAATGTIVYQGWIDGYGQTVFIDHGGGYMTQYSHLQTGGFLGRAGSTVQMGTPIAISGSTGVGTGAHLHFGVLQATSNGNIHTGDYIDPRSFVRE
jgi:Peptidase family M23